jgi:hypothetical protein
MIELEQIYDTLEPYIDRETILPDSDLNVDQGVDGDDFDEMMAQYQKAFNVDMTSYLWYFHSAEEGAIHSIGAAFSKPPYERVDHIPVTPRMLQDFAEKGKWDLEYPVHKLPQYRWDGIINVLLLVLFLSWALYSCLS